MQTKPYVWKEENESDIPPKPLPTATPQFPHGFAAINLLMRQQLFLPTPSHLQSHYERYGILQSKPVDKKLQQTLTRNVFRRMWKRS